MKMPDLLREGAPGLPRYPVIKATGGARLEFCRGLDPETGEIYHLKFKYRVSEDDWKVLLIGSGIGGAVLLVDSLIV